MIRLDEDSLICDLAETYNIYDYRQLPLRRVAVFCCGLSEDSRIKKKMNNQLVDMDTLLLGHMVDTLNLLLWSKTKDAQKGANKPASIVEKLIPKKEPEKDNAVFLSGEDFDKMRNELIKRIEEGGEGEWQRN